MSSAGRNASPEAATIQALRSDLAHELARFLASQPGSQAEAARRLAIPQPTLSKIVNGKVTDLSLELLIRVAVRAGLPLTLQTGKDSTEAGAYASHAPSTDGRRNRSRVAEEAREALLETARAMTPEQRLEAHLKHSELLTALHRAGSRNRTR